MKRIVLALAIVVMLAVPAMAQDVSVDVSGEFWGTFVAPSGGDNSFETFSPFYPSIAFHPNEYSQITLDGTVGERIGFTATYDVSFTEMDQIYAAYRPNTGLVNELRAGKFEATLGTGEFYKAFSNGAGVAGSIGAFDYDLAYIDSVVPFISEDNALNLRLGTDIRSTRVGATLYHDADDLDVFGADLTTTAGPFTFGGEYLFSNMLNIGANASRVYAFGEYAYSDKTTFFVKYYNAQRGLFGDVTEDANKLGVSYKVNDNVALRAMFVNSNILGMPGGFEAAVKATF